MSGPAGLAEVTVRVDRSVPICVRGEIGVERGVRARTARCERAERQPGAGARSPRKPCTSTTRRAHPVRVACACMRTWAVRSSGSRRRNQDRGVLVLTALADIVPLHDDADSAADALRRRV